MQIVSLVWGILAMLGLVVAFLPCLGSLNWLNIPFAGFGVIVSAIALATQKEGNRGGAIAGLVCCGIAIAVGLVRLWLGGGVV